MPETHPAQSPQPTQPQPPLPAAAPAQKSWFARHKVLTGIGAAVLAISAISAISGGGSNGAGAGSAAPAPGASQGDVAQPEAAAEPVAQPPAAAEPEAAALPKIGDTVTSGKLEVTVQALEEIGESVGGQYVSETAQGRYVNLIVSVANVGTDPKLFTLNALTLVDAEGRSFNADTMATIVAEPGANTWVTEINPGNRVEGGVVFDLPADVAPVTLKVSGGVFSGSAEISLLG